MDNTTLNVRCMSNAYPYPDANTQVRMDAFPSLLLSYLDRPAMSRPLRILDAGCGTCAGTVAVAALHPEAYGEPPEVELESEALGLEHPDKEVTAVDEAQKRMEEELATEEKQYEKILQQLDLEEKKRLKTLCVLDKKIEPVKPPQVKPSKAGKKKTQKSKNK